MVDRQHRFKQKVSGRVKANANYDDSSVLIRATGPVGNHNVDVDQYVSKQSVVK